MAMVQSRRDIARRGPCVVTLLCLYFLLGINIGVQRHGLPDGSARRWHVLITFWRFPRQIMACTPPNHENVLGLP
jgi:hypothetical protein